MVRRGNLYSDPDAYVHRRTIRLKGQQFLLRILDFDARSEDAMDLLLAKVVACRERGEVIVALVERLAGLRER